MLLVIDVSNTNMVLGVFNGENLVAVSYTHLTLPTKA